MSLATSVKIGDIRRWRNERPFAQDASPFIVFSIIERTKDLEIEVQYIGRWNKVRYTSDFIESYSFVVEGTNDKA
jgi:hypothetical protein